MINGYSKISGGSTNIPSKSRSIDFSDLTFYSPPQAHEAPKSPTTTPPQREVNTKISDDSTWPEVEGGGGGGGGGGGDGGRFGVILSRTCSSASQRFKASEKSHGKASLQAAVRRAFSMRKASEGYWRIHDTCDGDGNGELVEEEEEEEQQQRRRSPRKKRGRFARACKKLFGF